MIHRSLGRRKRLALILTTALVLLGAAAGSASAAVTRTFDNTAPFTIPGEGPAPPYPSNISVTGFAGNVQKATATLRGIAHTHIEDVVFLLVGPSGTNTLLMGNAGGSDDISDITVTLDQLAPSDVPADPLVSGTFRPTSTGAHTLEPLAPPAPGFPYPVNLGGFNGQPANGTWQLYVDDQTSGDVGTISGGWSLTLSAAVNTVTTGKPVLNKKKGTAKVPVTVSDSGNLAMSGKGVATVASAGANKSVAVGGPGTVKLKVKPKGKTRKTLNATGKAKVKVTVTFTPTNGTPNTVTKKIKLKKTV